MVTPRTWTRKEVVFYLQRKTTRRMGQSRWIDDDQIQRKRTPSFPSHESISRGTLKSKGGGKSSMHFCADGDTIETVLRTIISVNQLSIYGAVSHVCDECGSPAMLEQWRPVFGRDNLTHCPCQHKCWSKHLHLWLMILAQEDLLQKYQERMDKAVHNTDRVIKILYWCRISDDFWCRTVLRDKETLKNSHNLQIQWTCREYTLPRDKKSSDPKGWIRGNTKIGPVLEVTTSYLQGKYGVVNL